ncbi:hypothetical protein IGI04_019596 [Brassica rapa subsp. trilocularis]|uniref:Uncharacterized protein n=1 Tax=Brassica rapa subsp. trilocularis TaxID=1813537 RepID=A0ABQ7MGN0_BRACM|nr:hypothetical protein IGI04_019596 [Brassica rapa subsp. trilocularis]
MGERSHEIMSTHTLQAQGQRSTVALPEKIKAHRECRPGTKSKNIAPYGRGTKVIGKTDRGARQHPGTSMFQKGENQFHKLRVSRGRSPQTTMFQEDKFQNLRASGGYLTKSTRNCRTTHPTKVLLPRSCPIDLEGIPNGPTEATGVISTTAHIQSTLRVVNLRRTECNVVLRRIVRDYKFLHDVHRYLRVVRRRIGLHASTKGLVPLEEGMRKIAVFTRLLSSTELLHPKVRV